MSWSQLASLPAGLTSSGFCAAAGYLWCAGGQAGATRKNTLYRYDPAADAWTLKANIPDTIGDYPALVTDGTYLYLLGGSDVTGQSALNTVYRYNIAADSWTAKSNMIFARGSAACCAVLGGKLYIAGGRNSDGSDALTANDIYTIGTDTWAAGAALPDKRQYLATIGDTDGTYLYAVGGSHVQNPTTTNPAVSTFYRYDPAANTWTTLTSLMAARFQAACGVLNGFLYVVAGFGPDIGSISDKPQGDLFAYQFRTGLWTNLRDSLPYQGAAVGDVLNGKWYVLKDFVLLRWNPVVAAPPLRGGQRDDPLPGGSPRGFSSSVQYGQDRQSYL